jgi:hypothetical protein
MIARPLAVLAVLGLLAAAPALAGGGTPPPPKVSVAKPVVKEIQEWDDFIGRFEAVDQVDVRARVSGYLDRVLFQDGALVKAGDRLFTIDPRPVPQHGPAGRGPSSRPRGRASSSRKETWSAPSRCAGRATSPSSCSTSGARPFSPRRPT